MNPRRLNRSDFDDMLYDVVGTAEELAELFTPSNNRKPSAQEQRAAFYRSAGWKKARAAVLQRAGGQCEHCHMPDERLHLHHIEAFATVPQKRADPGNLVALCPECHDFVHSRANVNGIYIVEPTTK